MGEHKILRTSGDFKGLDRRTSTLQLGSEYSLDMSNASYRVSGAINKRSGYHTHSLNANVGAYGLATYKKVVPATGLVTDELLMVDSELKKLTEGTVTIAYSGSNEAWYSVKLDSDTNTFKFILIESILGEVLNYDLGTGLDGGDATLTNLEAQIDAVTNFTCTLGGGLAGSEPAGFLDVVVDVSVDSEDVNNTYVAPYKIWSNITRGDSAETATFPGYVRTATNLDDSDLENATFALLNDVIYVGNGYDELMKYDGTRVYRAGLPAPLTISPAEGGAGNPNGTYFYKIVYEYTDAQGNIVQSEPLLSSAITVASKKINVTVPYLMSGGWDLYQVGGSPSTQLQIKIYRNTNGAGVSGTFYYIGTVFNNTSGSSTVAVEDNLADASLAVDYIDHIKRHDPPPKGRYISAFQGCLIIAGQRSNVNNLQYSMPFDPTTSEIGSEYFPNDTNATIVESPFGDKITAIAGLRESLFIFHSNSIHLLSGELPEPTGRPYRVDLLTTEGGIGCVSQSSVQELQGSVAFLSSKGIYSINASTNLEFKSEKIKPLFEDPKGLTYSRKRAVGFNWTDKNVYLLHIPLELKDVNANQALFTNGGIILAYDYFKDAWLKWDNLDYTGGIALYGEKLFFGGRSLSATNLVESRLSSMTTTNTTFDFNDHHQPINFSYTTNWESLNEPTVPKKFLRLKIYAMDVDDTFESPQFSLTVTMQKDYNYTDLGSMLFQYGTSTSLGWGFMDWGGGGYGAAINQAVKSKLPTGKCKSIKYTFSNSALNENVLLTNYETEVVAPYRVEIKE